MESTADRMAAIPLISAFWAWLVTAISDSTWCAARLNHLSNPSVTGYLRSRRLCCAR